MRWERAPHWLTAMGGGYLVRVWVDARLQTLQAPPPLRSPYPPLYDGHFVNLYISSQIYSFSFPSLPPSFLSSFFNQPSCCFIFLLPFLVYVHLSSTEFSGMLWLYIFCLASITHPECCMVVCAFSLYLTCKCELDVDGNLWGHLRGETWVMMYVSETCMWSAVGCVFLNPSLR